MFKLCLLLSALYFNWITCAIKHPQLLQMFSYLRPIIIPESFVYQQCNKEMIWANLKSGSGVGVHQFGTIKLTINIYIFFLFSSTCGLNKENIIDSSIHTKQPQMDKSPAACFCVSEQCLHLVGWRQALTGWQFTSWLHQQKFFCSVNCCWAGWCQQGHL